MGNMGISKPSIKAFFGVAVRLKMMVTATEPPLAMLVPLGTI
ncbi:hypothetical protein CCACVL1_17173 [Corchorus capsularis]|uniref:Uncharacterized protein n=1 Tax=Corchorus capsularis TaxID=210143 RepID=A0A1R3HTR6_COCAP|nr:hypothetical protein CCACVL1_17173 [Corchorus capsularis]